MLPDHLSRFKVREHSLEAMRRSALKRMVQDRKTASAENLEYFKAELNADTAFVRKELKALGVTC